MGVSPAECRRKVGIGDKALYRWVKQDGRIRQLTKAPLERVLDEELS